jgi:GT2 family glycosyltransferase
VALLLDCLNAHSAAAISAPRLEDSAGVRQSSCFPFPGTARWLFENAPLSVWTRHVPFARQRSVSFRHGSASRQVPWVLGAAMLLRCGAVREVGGLDETYFMFYEEVDLCRKLARHGWGTYYVPNAAVMHVGAASTSQQSSAMLLQRIQSTIDYYDRHCTAGQRWLWTGLLRAKWAALLVRDAARLLVTADPTARRHLQDQQTVYRSALFTRAAAGAVTERAANSRSA